MIERLPAHVPEFGDDGPAAVDRIRPSVLLNVGHAAEGKDFAGLEETKY